MKLQQLTLNNFQGIKSLTLDFKGGHSASIYGDNATGKTTVYNALTWLLFDKASTTAKNFTPKTRGTDGDLHHLDHSSEAVFITDEGRIVTLKKIYKEVYKKKRGSAHEEFSGHTVEHQIDGVPVKEKDFTTSVLTFCGGDTEKPKMLTMPDYFPEQLAWDSRRKILLEICGDITDEEIIAANSNLKELPDFLRMTGTTEQYYTIDEYRKVAVARRADINKQLTEIPARIDEATQAIPDTTGLDADEIDRAIATLEKKRESLMEEKAAVATGDTATMVIRQRIAEAKTRLVEGRANHTKAQNGKNSGIEDDILIAQRTATEARRKVEDIEIDIRRKTAEVERLEEARSRLVSDYKEIRAEAWDESQTICPTCGQTLPADQVERMREDFNLRKSKRLEDINRRGKKEASKEQIATLRADVEDLTSKLVTARAAQSKAETEVKALRGKLAPTIAYEDTPEYDTLTAEIAALTNKLADAGKAIADVQNATDSKIRAVSEAIREERDKQMQLTILENQHRRISELEKQEKRLGGEYEELEKGLYLCDLFTKAKVDALTDRINVKFKSVRFRLFQEQLNGGLKEDCEVMIPRADGSMIPYAFANNAARINAGLEIINTLSKHWGVRMPVFIDNAESITHLIGTSTQTIRLVVSEPDKKLRLEVDE